MTHGTKNSKGGEMKRDTGRRETVIIQDASALRRALRRRNLTYRAVEAQTGIPIATLSRMLSKDGKPIKEASALKLLKLLDRDFEDFFVEGVFHVTRDYARNNRSAA